MSLRSDSSTIIKDAIMSSLPGKRVRELLFQVDFGDGDIVVIAVGKAAFQMAEAAYDILRSRISKTLVITKEGSKPMDIPNTEAVFAGHPYPNAESFRAADLACQYVKGLTENDHVLFLLSGGASALFEKPMVTPEDYDMINKALLGSGADITEINTVRKHLSYVKGGRFAKLCEPAKVHSIILSDVLGNDLSMVGSGPTVADRTTGQDAFEVLEKYHIRIPQEIIGILMKETPKSLTNTTYEIVGDIQQMLLTAKKTAEMLGYDTVLLSNSLTCEAREAGTFIAGIAKTFQDTQTPIAFIMGGETVVKLKGNGLGGRNQEMALSCAIGIRGLDNVCFFSVGSDGTDGPTDAAGGIVYGDTYDRIKKCEIQPQVALDNNDSYHTLKRIGSLIMTGPTGTNVNDLSVLLIQPKA